MLLAWSLPFVLYLLLQFTQNHWKKDHFFLNILAHTFFKMTNSVFLFVEIASLICRLAIELK